MRPEGEGRAGPAAQLSRALGLVLYLGAAGVHGLSPECGRQTQSGVPRSRAGEKAYGQDLCLGGDQRSGQGSRKSASEGMSPMSQGELRPAGTSRNHLSGGGRLGTFIHRLLAPGSQGWPRGLLSAQDAGPNVWSESRDRNGKAHSVRLRWGPVPWIEPHSCSQEPGGPGAVTRATTGVRHADAAPEGARRVVLTEELFLQRDGGLGLF